jgi:hypothetical protein
VKLTCDGYTAEQDARHEAPVAGLYTIGPKSNPVNELWQARLFLSEGGREAKGAGGIWASQ